MTSSSPRTVVIFPSKNQEDTIERVIRSARKSHCNPVVDAYSSDRTVKIANDNGAKVIEQDNRMFSAKGIAMKKGINEAIKNNANIVLFLDADIKNLSPEWVD